MADNSGLIKIGLFGAAAYLAYKQGWLSFLGLGTPAVSTAVTTTTTTTGTTTPVAVTPVSTAPPITGANSLDSIYTRVAAAASAGGAPSAGLSIDGWDYYLNNELAALGKVAPDPLPIFQAAVPNFDRSQLLTGPQYWGVMAPALKTQLGLSGLGIYGGLGAYLRRYA